MLIWINNNNDSNSKNSDDDNNDNDVDVDDDDHDDDDDDEDHNNSKSHNNSITGLTYGSLCTAGFVHERGLPLHNVAHCVALEHSYSLALSACHVASIKAGTRPLNIVAAEGS